MSSILFYSPFNQRSRDTESLMIGFRHQGHRVISLSQAEGHQIHEYLRLKGIETHSHVLKGNRGIWYYLRHMIFFISFCRREKIDVVYSHLEPANFVAALGQFLIRARVYICRHHVDEASLYNFDKTLYYKLTYLLAKKIIVVSQRAVRYMVDKEKIDPMRIIHINLAYDFDLYVPADRSAVKVIRDQHQAQLLCISVARFTKFKRLEFSVLTLRKLVDLGMDAKLILLGSGEEEASLRDIIRRYDLEARVVMPGYVSNVGDYLAASDFLLHPSILESSCVVVKEASLVHLPVIVCFGVGDFEDYVEDGKNGFLVNPQNFTDDAATVILEHFEKKELLREMGNKLAASVSRHFDLKNIIGRYDPLNRLA